MAMKSATRLSLFLFFSLLSGAVQWQSAREDRRFGTMHSPSFPPPLEPLGVQEESWVGRNPLHRHGKQGTKGYPFRVDLLLRIFFPRMSRKERKICIPPPFCQAYITRISLLAFREFHARRQSPFAPHQIGRGIGRPLPPSSDPGHVVTKSTRGILQRREFDEMHSSPAFPSFFFSFAGNIGIHRNEWETLFPSPPSADGRLRSPLRSPTRVTFSYLESRVGAEVR